MKITAEALEATRRKRSEIILETLGTFFPPRIKIIRRETRPLWNILLSAAWKLWIQRWFPGIGERIETFSSSYLLRFFSRVKRSMPAQLLSSSSFQDLKISRLSLKGPSNLSISLQINLIISSFTFVYLFPPLCPRLFPNSYSLKSTRFSGVPVYYLSVNGSVEMISLKGKKFCNSIEKNRIENHFLNGWNSW